ncbi:MAG: 16S rRNA (cytosine(1402)-N(4))-methyltransferase RsmH [Parcubacteria group bacterium]|nr:16S rRNA (cytosine(1402)-N(4))-methyltransferase RsmH [Parcubacteria group bacterium]MCR4342833.1 16S rRNA (cytosine(1402)-N(4))-methyltransferase RsmH [Patescibacteria group bacterium]
MIKHIPVLLNETIDSLNIKKGETVIDATLGMAGHSREICSLLGERGALLGLDQDKTVLEIAKENLSDKRCKIILENGNFRNIKSLSIKNGIEKADKILFDLGVNSMQFGPTGRGFSFLYDEPLLMTLKKDPEEDDLTAYKIVNSYSEKDIADIIYKYGEDRASRRIAGEIFKARKSKSIMTSGELAEVIKKAFPAKHFKINPATRTFQALRIAVNDELGALERGLEEGWEILNKGGRMSVISFHSLEDRIVKNFFRNLSKEKKALLVNKKPIIATREEIRANPRSRSAKLRTIEKI